MCEVCKCEGVDYKFKNGPTKGLNRDTLYKVYKDHSANISLCHIHSIELFMVGEKRFLKNHLAYARVLANKSFSYKQAEDSPFGF